MTGTARRALLAAFVAITFAAQAAAQALAPAKPETVGLSSEPGMRELGWTGNVFYPELPGCTHPGGHQD